MMPPIPSTLSWVLGPPNLDVVFSGLEIDVRTSVSEIRSLDQDIASLEEELSSALQQREDALKALANVDQNLHVDAANDRGIAVRHDALPAETINTATTEVGAPLGALAPTGGTDTDTRQTLHSSNGEHHFSQQGGLAPPGNSPQAEPDAPSQEPTSQSALTLVPQLTGRRDGRDEVVMRDVNPALTADDIKKRLLQVLRHLRDTATCCRQIPDLDRGFSNMLKTTYKELYDSLKEATPKGSGRQAAAHQIAAAAAPPAPTAATVVAVAAGGRGCTPARSAGRVAEDQPTIDIPGSGTGGQPTATPAEAATLSCPSSNAGPQPASSRDLSALARLLHAKRLHQQADSSAARDLDQPPVRRSARASTPATSSTSAGSKAVALYDGLPPVRVAGIGSHGNPARDSPAPETVDPLAPLLPTTSRRGEGTANLIHVPGSGSAAEADSAGVETPSGMGRGSPPPPRATAAKCHLAKAAEPEGTAVPGGGVGDASGCSGSQAAAGSSGCGGSPSQQLLEKARASGNGVARSLLMQTAQQQQPMPDATESPLKPRQQPLDLGAQRHGAEGDCSTTVPGAASSTGARRPDHAAADAAEDARSAGGNPAACQQGSDRATRDRLTEPGDAHPQGPRAKRALELVPPGGSGARAEPAASKRQHLE